MELWNSPLRVNQLKQKELQSPWVTNNKTTTPGTTNDNLSSPTCHLYHLQFLANED